MDRDRFSLGVSRVPGVASVRRIMGSSWKCLQCLLPLTHLRQVKKIGHWQVLASCKPCGAEYLNTKHGIKLLRRSELWQLEPRKQQEPR
jgi:hypothetical protein